MGRLYSSSHPPWRSRSLSCSDRTMRSTLLTHHGQPATRAGSPSAACTVSRRWYRSQLDAELWGQAPPCLPCPVPWCPLRTSLSPLQILSASLFEDGTRDT